MVDRLERLLNLVIALRQTRVPLTVEAINERVAGYGGERDEAWRRMFERDKRDLRGLGIPLTTAKADRLGETLGYTISPDDYDLPRVELTAQELTALALAVQLTGLGGEALPALDKLAVDADADVRAGAGTGRDERLPLSLSLDAPHRGPLTEALTERRAVRFGYRKATDAAAPPTTRTVEPHALLFHLGRWYLRGHDRDRGEMRTFRLDRIDGAVRHIGEADAFAIPPEPPDPRDVIPAGAREALDATVRASDEVAWTVARRARGGGVPDGEGWTRYTVRVQDRDTFLSWALAFGPELEVVGPPDLRRAIVAHLRAVGG